MAKLLQRAPEIPVAPQVPAPPPRVDTPTQIDHRQPNLSAYEATFGNFNFNQTPLAPPGTRFLVHKTTKQRASFAPHGVDGWYIGPSLDHYRCYNCYIPSMTGTRDAISVDWFPHQIPLPKLTTDDYLNQTADEMLDLI